MIQIYSNLMKVVGSLLFILLCSTSLFAQYDIKGKILGLSKSEVYLAHYFGYNQQVIKDTVVAIAADIAINKELILLDTQEAVQMKVIQIIFTHLNPLNPK